MLQIIARYIPFDTDVAFLQIKQDYIDNLPWLSAFYIHVFSSIFALAAGFTQFSNRIRTHRPRLHRAIGRAYVIDILLITGPAGFLMAFYANGGTTSRAAFLILSILWWAFTYLAYRAALHRDFAAHRRWMLRSFALTLSAITLRLWKMLIAHYFELPPMDLYRLVAWLGFVPNLLVIEWFIRSKYKPAFSK
jgi:uncharacterized membrane protein